MLDPVNIGVTNEIAKALDRALDSPSKELGNYIADKIRYLRYGALLKIIENAQKKAEQKNLHLKMPALKSFVPFAESASLEEEIETDSGLQELWANLLISATEFVDSRHLLYLRILKEITAKEVTFLERLIEGGRASTYLSPGSSHWPEEAPLFNQDTVYAALRLLPSETEAQTICDIIVDGLECPGVLFYSVAISEGTPYVDLTEVVQAFDSELYWSSQPQYDVLSSLGIVDRITISDMPFPKNNSLLIDIDGVRLTNLGNDFYETCTGKNFRKEFRTSRSLFAEQQERDASRNQ